MIDTALCDSNWASYQGIDVNVYYTESLNLNVSYFIGGNTLRMLAYTPKAAVPLSNWTLNATTMPDNRMPSSDAIVGVAINGVLLFAGVSSYGYDAFFPKAYGNMKNPQAVSVDICLGSAYTYNTYRYHMFSPCIYDISAKSTAMPCS